VPLAILTPPSPNGCPQHWIRVPAYQDDDTNVPAFCVMKYEAKDVGGVATSRPEGAPWTAKTRGADASEAGSAWKACADLGADLITNLQWQSIARQIETATHPDLTAPHDLLNWEGH